MRIFSKLWLFSLFLLLRTDFYLYCSTIFLILTSPWQSLYSCSFLTMHLETNCNIFSSISHPSHPFPHFPFASHNTDVRVGRVWATVQGVKDKGARSFIQEHTGGVIRSVVESPSRVVVVLKPALCKCSENRPITTLFLLLNSNADNFYIQLHYAKQRRNAM